MAQDTIPEGHYEVAQELILDAEKELGLLSKGQRTDLLADNTNWNLHYIRHVIDMLQAKGCI